MGQHMKTYLETDNIGVHKVIEYPNGRKIRVLKEPSEWYKEKQRKKAEAAKIEAESRRVAQEKENLIKQKMRELAIKELEAEGKM